MNTKKVVSEMIPRDTGIATSLTDREIKEYVNEVIDETRNRRLIFSLSFVISNLIRFNC
jgi:hypothetical protein